MAGFGCADFGDRRTLNGFKHRQITPNHVRTTALGCPAEQSSAAFGPEQQLVELSLDRTAESGCPHVVRGDFLFHSRIPLSHATIQKSPPILLQNPALFHQYINRLSVAVEIVFAARVALGD